MKIARSDNKHLVVVDFPIFLAAWFSLGLLIGITMLVAAWNGGLEHLQVGELVVGCVFVGLGGTAIVSALNRTVFDFDLSRRSAIWDRKGLLGHKSGNVTLEDFRFAYVRFSSSGKGLSYSVCLRMGEESFPMRHYGTGDLRDCRTVRDAINSKLGKTVRTDEDDLQETVKDILQEGDRPAAIRCVRKVRRYGSFAEADAFVRKFE